MADHKVAVHFKGCMSFKLEDGGDNIDSIHKAEDYARDLVYDYLRELDTPEDGKLDYDVTYVEAHPCD